MAKAKQPEQKKEKTEPFVPPKEWFDVMAREEKRAGLPAGMLRSIYDLEAANSLQRFETDPTAYHYDADAKGRRKSTARGLFGTLESTAKQPGMGIKPIENWTLDESARFAADHAATLLRRADGNPYKAFANYYGSKSDSANAAYANKIVGRMRMHNPDYIKQLDKKGVTPQGGSMPPPKVPKADTRAAPTETRGGLSPQPRLYSTDGTSRMPAQDGGVFQQPERSDLQRGIQEFRDRQAAGAPEPAPVRGLASQAPVMPARSAMAAAGETFTAGPVSREAYAPVPSPRMFSGRMIEQPAPQAMEPFTPRSTYAEQIPSRDVFSRYAVQQPEPQAVEQFVPRSTYAERNPSQDVFSRYSVEQPAPPRVRTSFPPPPAEPYDSGNYTPIPSPRMYNGRMVEQPAPQRGYDTNGPSRFSQMPGAPAAPEQSAMRGPDTAFMDWYDQLVGKGIIQPAQQGLGSEAPSQYSPEPYPEDWQDQLSQYYMDTRGTRYRPEMAPIRTSTPQPVFPESYSEPEQFVPLRQQDVTPPPYYTPEPVADVPETPEVPAGWSSRLKLYGR